MSVFAFPPEVEVAIELSKGRRVVWNWSSLTHNDTTMQVIEVATGKVICRLFGHTDMIRNGTEIEGNRLLTWSNDQTSRIWNLENGETEQIFKEMDSFVYHAQPSGDRLICLTGDGHVHLFDLKSGVKISALKMREKFGNTVAPLPNQDRFAVFGEDIIVLAALSTGRIIDQTRRSGSAIDVAPLGQHSICLLTSDAIEIWNFARLKKHADFEVDGFLSKFMVIDAHTIFLVAGRYRSDEITLQTLSADGLRPLDNAVLRGGGVTSVSRPSEYHVAINLADFRSLIVSIETLKVEKVVAASTDHPLTFPVYDPESTELAALGDIRDRPRYFGYEDVEACEIERTGGIDVGEIASDIRTMRAHYDGFNCYFGSPLKVQFISFEDLPTSLLPCMRSALNRDTSYHRPSDLPSKILAAEHGLAGQDVISATAQLLEGQRSAHWLSANGKDLIIWSHEDNSVVMLSVEGGTTMGHSLVAPADECWVPFHGPLIKPDGSLCVIGKTGFPMIRDPRTGNPVRVDPQLRQSVQGHLWDDDDRVFLLSRSEILIRCGVTGDRLGSLERGDGLPFWGMAQPDTGCLITWSRSVLRSWNLETMRPSLEIKDPGDWGPGYEVVVPVQNGRIAYSAGQYTMDDRIIVWDGQYDLSTFRMRFEEVQDLFELPDGTLGVSYCDDVESHFKLPAKHAP